VDFVTEYSTDITIHAPADKVWEVLTSAMSIKEFLNVTVATSWEKGSAITYQHNYEGETFIDKGVILDIIPQQLLHLAYLPALGNLEDKPDNYQDITVEVTAMDSITTVKITQANIKDGFFGKRAPEIWGEVLRSIKEIAER
jgi:uncharacterized protein YndB with AHSA1/START domain